MTKFLLPTLTLAVTFLTGCGDRPRPPCDEGGEIATICGFRNPEDLEYVAAADLVLVSNMRHDGPNPDGGYLSAMKPTVWAPYVIWGEDAVSASASDPGLGDAQCTSPPSPGAFYPHGLTSTETDGRTLIYVAAHAGSLGGREAVEIFELGGTGNEAQLTWKACIPSPNAVQLNDVAVSSLDGRLIASNYLPTPAMRHSVAASIFRRPTGDIVVWSREKGWTRLQRTEALMANGVALAEDGTTLFYVEAIGGKLHRRSVDSPGAAIDIDIEGVPDNLTWTSRGTLLLASHKSGAGLMKCFLRSGECRVGWSVYEIAPTTMAAENILTHSGDSIGAVATALEIDGELLLGSVFDDRIGRIRLKDPPDGANDQ